MESGQNHKGLMKGILILTIGAIITKILSAVYRIPFQNMVGDVGFYIYQQVYPFYGLALVLTTSGFPIIISKFYAEKKGQNDLKSASRFLIVSFFYLFIIGVASFMVMYFGAHHLAVQMNDSELVILFRVISIIFLILPFNAVLRGYFQGNGYMLPTAVSQVGEQMIRVATILIVSYIFMRQEYSLYLVGAGAAFGSITGGIISAVILGYYWGRMKQEDHPLKCSVWESIRLTEIWGIVKILSIQGFAICITGMLLILIQLADSLNLYTLLVETRIQAEEAKALKGVYDRGQPLLQLGTILATSMSLSLVPLISSEKLKNNKAFLYDKIQTALKISILVGAGGSIGLFFIIKPTNIMLFNTDHGSSVLAIISLLIFLCSVIITISSILQGLGESILPAAIILLGFALKLLLNIPLVLKFGTHGAAISSVVAMVVVLALLCRQLKKIFTKTILPKGFLGTIGMGGALMGGSLLAYLKFTDMIFSDARSLASFQAVSAVLIGGLLYLVFVLRKGMIKEEELLLLPFGSKLMLLLPDRNRR
jgi:O-antigen/teichoic acid export membrane protein